MIVLGLLQILENEVKNQEKNYNYMCETGRQMVNRSAAGPQADKLRSHMDCLHRWTELVDAVNKRLSQCQSVIEQLKHYRVSLICMPLFQHPPFRRPLIQQQEYLLAKGPFYRCSLVTIMVPKPYL